jgi:membrane fusion protein (multidrug efflux system)
VGVLFLQSVGMDDVTSNSLQQIAAAPPSQPARAPDTGQPSEMAVEPVPGRRTRSVILVVLLLAGIGTATIYWMEAGSGSESTSDAYVDGRVIRVSPKVSGQVVRLLVDDNAMVRAGDLLFEIDPADFQAKVDQAAAALRTAQSSVEQAKATVLRAEAGVGEAEAALRVAGTEARRRVSDYRRYAAMGTEGVTAQQLETAKAAADSGEDQRIAAEKKVAAAGAELNVAKTSVATAGAEVEAARAQLRLAQLQLQYTKVLATESGRVTRKTAEAGAFVAAGQPTMFVVPKDIWIIANFKEVQLSSMRAGQPVTIRVDAYPDTALRGHVESAQAGTGSRFQLLPPENATGNWVKVVQRVPVKILLEPNQPESSRIVQGMSVGVTVDTRREGKRLTGTEAQ